MLPDSTTTMDSPFFTLSPGDFSQLTILPSVIVDDRAGMKTSFTAFIVCRERRPRVDARRGWQAKAWLAKPAFDATLMVPDCAMLSCSSGLCNRICKR